MNLEDLKEKHLSDPRVKEAYDALEPEFQVIRAMIEARRGQQSGTLKTSQKD